MKIHVPGKLILSGEHSILYGQPALAMAVNRYAIASASPQLLPLISFDLSDLSYQHGLPFTALQHLKNRVKEKYQRFMRGEFNIREVLQKPMELAQFALSLFLENMNLKLTQGIKIHLQSSIPIGCGMGSSAATVLSIVRAIAHHLQITISDETLFRVGLEAEKMQHGYSSGLDLRVCLQGGCLFIHQGEIQTRALPKLPLYLVNTGMPKTTTGECVNYAASYFKESELKNDFASVTLLMDKALQLNHMETFKEAVSLNHQLLTKIQVVPAKVQQFIHDIEESGGAAKTCGAGAISGEEAGIVLVVTENITALMTLCTHYHYTVLPVSGELRGVHLA